MNGSNSHSHLLPSNTYNPEQYEGIYEILDNYAIRTISFEGLNETVAERIIKLRPMPSSFVIFAGTEEMDRMFKRAVKFDMIERPDRWYFFYMDFSQRLSKEITSQYPDITQFLPNNLMCCQYSVNKNCDCNDQLTVSSQRNIVHKDTRVSLFISFTTIRSPIWRWNNFCAVS